jgi:prolipoprotein diacylglyceryltransferase
MLAALLAAAATWPGRKWAQAKAGLRWWLFLALSAAGRLFVEGFRGDSILMWDVYRQAQVLAWLVLAASLWQIGRRWADRAVDLPIQPP